MIINNAARIAGSFAVLLFAFGLQGCSKDNTGDTPGNTVTSVEVQPAGPSVVNGQNKQFTAIAHFQDGGFFDVSNEATWSSSAPAVAGVTGTGLAQSHSAGQTTISAVFDGVTGSSTLTVLPVAVDHLELQPLDSSFAKGTTKQFAATAVYNDGTTADVTPQAEWTSASPGAVAISASGLAQAKQVGTTTITATYGGASANTSVTVTPATLTGLNVTPSSASIAKGTDQQFVAIGTFSDTTTQDLTESAAWSSSSAAATVSNATGTHGLAHGVDVGTSTISASVQGMSASGALTITSAVLSHLDLSPTTPSVPKGATRQFTATGTFSDGTTQDLTATATWASSNPAAATIADAAPNKGLATAVAVGTSTISAAVSGQTASTLMTVTAAALTSIQVTPANPQLATGFKLAFRATGVFSDNTNADLTDQVTWSSSDTGKATISNAAGSKGIATGVAAGATTIGATQGSVLGTTTLTVKSITLTKLQVSPATATIPLGTAQQYAATGTFSDNSTQDLTTQVTWGSSDPTIATISNASGSQGLAQSVKQGGPINITAARGSTSGIASLTVSAAALSSIAVTPATASVPKGQTATFVATGTYTDGSTRNVTADAGTTWSSSDANVATTDNSAGNKGKAKGVNVGTANIVATQSGKSGSATLTVTAATLQSIAVSPVNGQFSKGLQQQYTAQGTYSDNSQRDITSDVTWTTGNKAIATVSNAPGSTGVATMVAAGTTTIAAAQGTITKSTNLTVTNATLTSITITPANTTIVTGSKQQMTATGHYSDSSTHDITTQVTWSTTDQSTVDVDNAIGSQGLATGKKPGTVTVTAIYSGVAGTTQLTVQNATLQSIDVTPKDATIHGNGTQQYKAEGTFSPNNLKQDLTTQVTWFSSDTTVVTISNADGSKGLASGALFPGSAQISATLSNVTGSTGVTHAIP